MAQCTSGTVHGQCVAVGGVGGGGNGSGAGGGGPTGAGGVISAAGGNAAGAAGGPTGVGGTAGGSTMCLNGAPCLPGDCSAPAGDCIVACTCDAGKYACKSQCSFPADCAPGVACTPNQVCGATMNGTCWTSCLCKADGTFRCDQGCDPSVADRCFQPPGVACTGGVELGEAMGCFIKCDCGPDKKTSAQLSCAGCPPSPPPAGYVCQGKAIQDYPVGATCPYPDRGVTCSCPLPGTPNPYWDCHPG